ncbi:MAG: ATP-binding protein [Rhodothermales bacterium]|nr:ATP-binding protein [Rhodothermales bacterium]MBO6779017.1 ATP-binding protein [Rhodothermales bacterium]
MLRRLLIFLCACLPFREVCGQASSQILEGYHIRHWTSNEGLPVSHVEWIRSSSDGYLWLATGSGLVRFDGVEFRTFSGNELPGWSSNYVEYLWADCEDTLWAFERRTGHALQYDPDSQGFSPTSGIAAISSCGDWPLSHSEVVLRGRSDADALRAAGAAGVYVRGDSLMAISSAGLFQLTDQQTVLVKALSPDEAPDDALGIVTAEGEVWYQADGWLGRWDGRRFHRILRSESELSTWSLASEGIHVSDGRSLLYAHETGADTVLSAFPPGSLYRILATDRENRPWVRFDFPDGGSGIGFVEDGRLRTVDLGVRVGTVNSVAEDREGTVWVGSDAGLFALRHSPFELPALVEDSREPLVKAVAEVRPGVLLVGTWEDGIYLLSGNQSQRVALANITMVFGLVETGPEEILVLGSTDTVEWPSRTPLRRLTPPVRRALVDETGTVWQGGRELYRGDTLVPGVSQIWALEQLGDSVLVGTESGLFGGTSAGMMPIRSIDEWVVSIQPSSLGGVWLGTNGSGLLHLGSGGKHSLTAEQGLPSEGVWCALETEGWVWLSTDAGLSRFALGPPDDPFARARAEGVTTYTEADGLQSREFNRGGNSCAKSTDGRLHFGSLRGLVSVIPGRISRNEQPPRIQIRQVDVDGIPAPYTGDELNLPPGVHNLTVRFASSSMASPEKNRFWYRLNQNQLAPALQGQRELTLIGLRHGVTEIEVHGTNNDGVRSASPAMLRVAIEPRILESWWGRLGVALILVTLGSFWFRQRDVLRRARIVEAQRVSIAHDLHDDLGSRLGALMLRLELLAQRGAGEAISDELSALSETARSISGQFRDTLWLISPERDRLADLTDRIRQHVDKVLPPGSWNVEASAEQPEYKLGASFRRHVFLAFKEAVHNAAKHAQASRFSISVHQQGRTLEVRVEDDGRGFDPAAPRRDGSMGLDSMQRRAAAVGGSAVVTSGPGQGTVVTFTAPLSK